MLEEQARRGVILHVLNDEDMREISQAAATDDKSIAGISREKMVFDAPRKRKYRICRFESGIIKI
jgi:hypothetical protein